MFDVARGCFMKMMIERASPGVGGRFLWRRTDSESLEWSVLFLSGIASSCFYVLPELVVLLMCFACTQHS